MGTAADSKRFHANDDPDSAHIKQQRRTWRIYRKPTTANGLPSVSSRWRYVVIALAASLAVLPTLFKWHGVDLAAQIYHLQLFRTHGFVLWDSQWYGGHFTVSYSVFFPPIASLLGITGLAVVFAGLSAWAFHELVIEHFGRAGLWASIAFAAGTMVQVSVGQLPFLMGEAFGLLAILCAHRRYWKLSYFLAAAASLTSPVAGAFLCLAMLARLLTPPRLLVWQRIGFLLASGIPILLMGLAFPGTGSFPFAFSSVLFTIALCIVALCYLRRQQSILRVGIILYAVATVITFFVPTPLGANMSRLASCAGVPLIFAIARSYPRRLAALLVTPFLFWQWTPAFSSMASSAQNVADSSAYFAPLLNYLSTNDVPAGRVEVVPLADHWESSYVAPVIPLARGWERQLDREVNPLFYGDTDSISEGTYDNWLVNSGVRWVALPDASLDYSGKAEAELLRRGVPGLHVAWSNANWTVWAVDDSPGLIDGPADLMKLDGGTADLRFTQPGTALLRVRWSGRWSVAQGSVCLAPTSDGWMSITSGTAQDVRLTVDLLPHEPNLCTTAAG